jgi:hypothetical protein
MADGGPGQAHGHLHRWEVILVSLGGSLLCPYSLICKPVRERIVKGKVARASVVLFVCSSRWSTHWHKRISNSGRVSNTYNCYFWDNRLWSVITTPLECRSGVMLRLRIMGPTAESWKTRWKTLRLDRLDRWNYVRWNAEWVFDDVFNVIWLGCSTYFLSSSMSCWWTPFLVVMFLMNLGVRMFVDPLWDTARPVIHMYRV